MRAMRTGPRAVVALGAMVAPCAAQTCEPGWSEEYWGSRPPGEIRAMAVWDDGDGDALFLGSRFGTGKLSRWDGERLTYHGTFYEGQIEGGLSALLPFDDGAGEVLWGGGSFTEVDGVQAAFIATWDGEQWRPVGFGMDSAVRAFEVYDEGAGERLFAGGYFTRAGTAFAGGVARWDGQQWAPLGSGLSGVPAGGSLFLLDTAALTMRTFEGKGPESLYVGGMFTHAGGVQVNGVARWDGSAWSGLGPGVSFNSVYAGTVYAMEVYDDGAGEALYVGGAFYEAGGVPSKNVARWDGEDWSALGTEWANQTVTALKAYDLGAGPRLFCSMYTGYGTFHVLQGGQWSLLDGFVSWGNPGRALLGFDDGAGPRLYASVQDMAPWPMPTFRRWDGKSWGEIPTPGADQPVEVLRALDDGTGAALYVGGARTIGGVRVDPVGKYDGASWSRVGGEGEISQSVTDLEVFDDGTGARLFACNGGVYRLVDGHWVSMAPPTGGSFTSIRAYDDGFGERLYAAGQVPFGVRVWDGKSWAIPGSGIPIPVSSGQRAYQLEVYDSGYGSRVYVASDLGVHVYSGQSWVLVSDPQHLGKAWALLAAGNALYGIFGDQRRVHSASGNGAFEWTPVGGPPGVMGAYAMRWLDDGRHRGLYVGGRLGGLGSGEVLIARLDGATWEQIAASETDGDGVVSLAATDFGTPALWAGGTLREVNGMSASHLGVYEGCEPCYADCNRDGALNLADFGCFQYAFGSWLPNSYPDCNGDGARTLADFGCFQTKFALGCP